MQPVRKEDGERMVKELGAVKYVECSALTQFKLKDVFDEVNNASHLFNSGRRQKTGVAADQNKSGYCRRLRASSTQEGWQKWKDEIEMQYIVSFWRQIAKSWIQWGVTLDKAEARAIGHSWIVANMGRYPTKRSESRGLMMCIDTG